MVKIKDANLAAAESSNQIADPEALGPWSATLTSDGDRSV